MTNITELTFYDFESFEAITSAFRKAGYRFKTFIHTNMVCGDIEYYSVQVYEV